MITIVYNVYKEKREVSSSINILTKSFNVNQDVKMQEKQQVVI